MENASTVDWDSLGLIGAALLKALFSIFGFDSGPSAAVAEPTLVMVYQVQEAQQRDATLTILASRIQYSGQMAELAPSGKDRIVVRGYGFAENYAFLSEPGKLTIRSGETVLLERSDFDSISMTRQPSGEPGYLFQCTGTGKKRLAAATREHKGQSLALYLDETLCSQATVREAITGGEMVLSGPSEGLKETQPVLLGGALPCPITLLKVETK